MTSQLPTWTAFHPDAAPALSSAGGHVVALVSLRRAREEGWAPGLADDLARAWAASGRRVVLADLDLADPALHAIMGLDNTEGITDSVAFGASVGRVARPVGDAPYFFISAGTAVADPGSFLEHPRWDALCRGFRQAGATLVAFVPWEAETRAHVLDQATDIVLLGTPEDDAPGLDAEISDRLRAVMGRESSGDEGAHEADEPWAGREGEGVDEVLPGTEEVFSIADLAPQAGDGDGPEAEEEAAAPMEAPLGGDGTAAEEAGDDEHPPVPLADEILAEAGDAPEPVSAMGEGPAPSPSSRGVPAPRRGLSPLVVTLLVVALLVAVILWWLGFLTVPGLSAPGASAAERVESVTPLAAAEPAVETAPAAAWAVAVEAHADRATAWSRAEALSRAAPAHLWITAPVEVDGTVFHRVLVGTATQPSMAEALRRRVAGEMGADPGRWLVRSTPLAYALGETDGLDAARRRVDALRELDIPAYVLAVSYSDGSERFRVYAGAFADAEEASTLGNLLADRGLTGRRLADRVGRRPE